MGQAAPEPEQAPRQQPQRMRPSPPGYDHDRAGGSRSSTASRIARDQIPSKEAPANNPWDSHRDRLHSGDDIGTFDKAQELCGILKALEGLLENPEDYMTIGSTYRRLAEWTWEHQQDSDFPLVLELMTPENMYPAWRRQALEEAYMLFYEDCAKQGNPRALEHLPEPPTSKEIGYRPLPEALLDPRTTRGAAFTNHYEAGSACCVRRRWDYDVVRNGPRPKQGEKRTVGRKIVPKDATERYCACAADPMTRLWQAFVPEAMCCGRDRKVPAASPDDRAGHASSKEPLPSQKASKLSTTSPPPWAGHSTAAAPPSTSPFKPKPRGESAQHSKSQWPEPPQFGRDTAPGVDEEVPELAAGRQGRADQALLAEDKGVSI